MAYDPTEKDLHPAEASSGAPGIIFHLPSRRRYIPYAWLLYADMNREGTEIQFHFTHSMVAVTGTDLEPLHDWVSESKLGAVRESPPSLSSSRYPIVRRIEISEKTGE
jgi:hypothetical protein